MRHGLPGLNRRALSQRLGRLFLAGALGLLMAACGGNSSVAGGGIGGTGKGTITSVNPASVAGSGTLAASPGSVTLNGTRTFTTYAGTEYSIDGDPVTAADLAAVGQGLVARVDVGDDVSADFSSGTAERVRAEHVVIGPVTQVAPLQVLGQDVVTTSSTAPADAASLTANVDDVLEVSGNTNATGVIQATRLELAASAPAVWRLTGTVANVVAGTSFDIGTQTVNFNGVTPQDCGGGLQAGDVVKVKATPDADVTSGGALSTTTSIECVKPGLDIPPGFTSGALVVDLEGFVSAVNGSGFTLDEQPVVTTGSTVYQDGSAADLQAGARVEVIGSLDVASGVLTATKVEFSERRVRILAPVSAHDSVAKTLTMLGITIYKTALTQGDVGVFELGSGNQVQVEGFQDNGVFYATSVNETSNGADASDVSVQGPGIDDQVSPVFSLLGISVDVTGMELKGPEPAEATLMIPDFFNLLGTQPLLELQHGAWDGSKITNDAGGPTTISFED
ncbi:MAG TPA: DUF5666 domain-containing protein [bacterium]|nr:DUF5666 domain-containing protein [bacterium]